MKDSVKRRVGVILFLGGIGLWSCGGKKIAVEKTPASRVVYRVEDNELLSGYPKFSTPWIVFSAQEEGAIYDREKQEQANKKASFLAPFVVLKKRGDRYKVAPYKTGSMMNGKMDRAQVQSQSWIGEKDLLLWGESLKSATTGFRLKGLLTLHHPDVIANSEQFVQSDSISLFRDPSLLQRSSAKMPLNAVVYLYKFSADNKRVLVGDRPRIDADHLDSTRYGWIDARILSVWGERTAFKVKPTPGIPAIQVGLERSETAFIPVISSSEIQDIHDFYHIFPLTYHWRKDDFSIRYWDHYLDYSANWLYNVGGQPIAYDTYKKRVVAHRKLNLVFVLDGSREVMDHLGAFKVIMQGLAEQFDQESYFDSISYSTLFYHVSAAVKQGSDQHTQDFSSWFHAFERPMEMPEHSAANISLYEAMDDLSSLLKSRENESNLVVVIGKAIQPKDKEKQQRLIDKLVDTHSRLLFYQVQANYLDPDNDFVLFAEEVIKASSNQLIPYKKQLLIRHEDVVEGNEFDLSQGNQGFYHLDYPLQSMHQGAVLFPKKGQVNAPLALQNTLQRITQAIVIDNKKIDSTLTAAFTSDQGMSRTKIKATYQPFFQQDQPYVPLVLAKQLERQSRVFMQEGILKKQEDIGVEALEYGVLLDEEELADIRDYYLSIYAAVIKNKKNLSNRRMIRRYIQVARGKSVLPNKVTKSFLLANTMSTGLFQRTGLYETNADSLSVLKLKQWKQTRRMNAKMLEDFFSSFKTKASEIEEHKGDKTVRLQQNDHCFYWLNQAYIPILNYSNQQLKDQSFDLLPVELEKIKEQNPKKEVNEGHAKDYIERVKKGMP